MTCGRRCFDAKHFDGRRLTADGAEGGADDIFVPMVVNECDCVAIATALQAVDRFASEDDADHEKFVSKLDAESSCRTSATK